MTEPALHQMTNAEYHSHPALSASGMKTLLEAPAKFAWQREHPTLSNSFDFGSVWHKMVLKDDGEAFEVVQKKDKSGQTVDAGDDKTVSAQAHIESIRAAGKIPIFRKQLTVIEAMVDVFRSHPQVREYLDLSRGSIEQSAIWTDPRTGVELRARFDFLPDARAGEAFTIVDPKTAQSSEPYTWLRKAIDYGYVIQDALYRRAVMALGLHPRPDFMFLVQEKSAPYIVTPIRLAAHSRAVGDHLVDKAIDTYAKCVKTDNWGGYADDVVHDDLPQWYLNRFEGAVA